MIFSFNVVLSYEYFGQDTHRPIYKINVIKTNSILFPSNIGLPKHTACTILKHFRSYKLVSPVLACILYSHESNFSRSIHFNNCSPICKHIQGLLLLIFVCCLTLWRLRYNCLVIANYYIWWNLVDVKAAK